MKRTPGSRREGRTLAVQLIFMLDHNPTPFEEVWPAFVAFKRDDDEPLVASDKSRVFCEALGRGVVEHWKEIDARIKETTANFALHRIGGVERAILRLGIYEMLYCLETPPVVSINEAVELAKRFSGDEAGRFINGVLDKIRATLSRPARTAATPDAPAVSAASADAGDPLARMEEQMQRVARELGESSGAQPEDYSPGGDQPAESR
jgi:N utilization substance protein B